MPPSFPLAHTLAPALLAALSLPLRRLDECPACLRHYGVEERVKALVATKASGERAPEYLVERVRLQISLTTIIRRPGV